MAVWNVPWINNSAYDKYVPSEWINYLFSEIVNCEDRTRPRKEWFDSAQYALAKRRWLQNKKWYNNRNLWETEWNIKSWDFFDQNIFSHTDGWYIYQFNWDDCLVDANKNVRISQSIDTTDVYEFNSAGDNSFWQSFTVTDSWVVNNIAVKLWRDVTVTTNASSVNSWDIVVFRAYDNNFWVMIVRTWNITILYKVNLVTLDIVDTVNMPNDIFVFDAFRVKNELWNPWWIMLIPYVWSSWAIFFYPYNVLWTVTTASLFIAWWLDVSNSDPYVQWSYANDLIYYYWSRWWFTRRIWGVLIYEDSMTNNVEFVLQPNLRLDRQSWSNINIPSATFSYMTDRIFTTIENVPNFVWIKSTSITNTWSGITLQKSIAWDVESKIFWAVYWIASTWDKVFWTADGSLYYSWKDLVAIPSVIQDWRIVDSPIWRCVGIIIDWWYLYWFAGNSVYRYDISWEVPVYDNIFGAYDLWDILDFIYIHNDLLYWFSWWDYQYIDLNSLWSSASSVFFVCYMWFNSARQQAIYSSVNNVRWTQINSTWSFVNFRMPNIKVNQWDIMYFYIKWFNCTNVNKYQIYYNDLNPYLWWNLFYWNGTTFTDVSWSDLVFDVSIVLPYKYDGTNYLQKNEVISYLWWGIYPSATYANTIASYNVSTRTVTVNVWNLDIWFINKYVYIKTWAVASVWVWASIEDVPSNTTFVIREPFPAWVPTAWDWIVFYNQMLPQLFIPQLRSIENSVASDISLNYWFPNTANISRVTWVWPSHPTLWNTYRVKEAFTLNWVRNGMINSWVWNIWWVFVRVLDEAWNILEQETLVWDVVWNLTNPISFVPWDVFSVVFWSNSIWSYNILSWYVQNYYWNWINTATVEINKFNERPFVNVLSYQWSMQLLIAWNVSVNNKVVSRDIAWFVNTWNLPNFRQLLYYDNRIFWLRIDWMWLIVTSSQYLEQLWTSWWVLLNISFGNSRCLSTWLFSWFFITFFERKLWVVEKKITDQTNWFFIYEHNDLLDIWVFSEFSYVSTWNDLYVFWSDNRFRAVNIKDTIIWVKADTTDEWFIVQDYLDKIKWWDVRLYYKNWTILIVWRKPDWKSTQVLRYVERRKAWFIDEYNYWLNFMSFYDSLGQDEFTCVDRSFVIRWWITDLWEVIVQRWKLYWPIQWQDIISQLEICKFRIWFDWTPIWWRFRLFGWWFTSVRKSWDLDSIDIVKEINEKILWWQLFWSSVYWWSIFWWDINLLEKLLKEYPEYFNFSFAIWDLFDYYTIEFINDNNTNLIICWVMPMYTTQSDVTVSNKGVLTRWRETDFR